VIKLHEGNIIDIDTPSFFSFVN